MTAAALRQLDAAKYCGVSRTFFCEHIRPFYPPDYDLRAPGTTKPMPAWKPETLDRFLATRQTQRSA